MGRTILPPTQREIESENRELKTENEKLLGNFVRVFQEESDSAFCRLYFIEASKILSRKNKENKRTLKDSV